MVEQTIQHLARKLAGIEYERIRSCESLDEKAQFEIRGRAGIMTIEAKAFGKMFPTVKDYIAGRYHGKLSDNNGVAFHVDDGSVTQETPCWMHYIDPARKYLAAMLGMPNVHENLKRAAYEALIEDREKQLKQEARGQQGPNITQRKLH